MNKGWWHTAASALGVLLFGVALSVLHHELRAHHWKDVVAALRALPGWRVALAIALTALNYAALTGYDGLAFLFLRNRLPYRRIALASFIAYVFSHNVGLAFLGGSAVRFRLYSGWGLTTSEIATVVGFNAITFWLGFLLLLGLALILAPPPMPAAMHLPLASTQLLGTVCLAALAAYLVIVSLRKTPLRWRTWELGLPAPRLSLAQVALSSLDWALAASVLYVLLPPMNGVPFATVLGAFLLAQIAGLVSNVPGGLGVFETVMVVLLRPHAPSDALLGSLLAYRIVYYFVPFLVAVGLLTGYEALQRREGIARAGRFFGRWVPGVVPHALAFSTFLGGAVLLASGATPAAHGRLGWLADFLPLPVLEVSHFAGSLIGVALLLLARGLQRRLDAAYLLASALLASGIVLSLLKGFDYEEAIILSLMLAALLPCRPEFYRRASLLDEPLSASWIVAILLVLLGTGWLLLLSYKHIEYSADLWWQFELSGQAPRSLRAEAGAVVLLALYGAAHLLRPARPEPEPPDADDLAHVRALAAAAPSTNAQLSLLGDKVFLFNDDRTGFIMYRVEGRSWVALGDPVAPASEARELVWQFHELSDQHGGWTVFYQVRPENLPLYLDLGLSPLKLGEEARVSLPSFTLEGGARKGLRQAHHRLTREGCVLGILPPHAVSEVLSELRTISDAWLAEKRTREKGFSLGFFDPAYLQQFPVALVRRNERIVAFANVLLGSGKQELSIDLMRYLPDAPPGVMDFLFIELMLWGKAQGYQWFNLGMAPMSGFEDRALAPLWSRLGAFVFRHGEDFYNFQGLRQYKEKFGPVWEPRYLASPGGFALPVIVSNIASLISGGLRGIVTK
jgi:phosphatidylglycerol lysyltransferase